jgi:hypothetical protein
MCRPTTRRRERTSVDAFASAGAAALIVAVRGIRITPRPDYAACPEGAPEKPRPYKALPTE